MLKPDKFHVFMTNKVLLLSLLPGYPFRGKSPICVMSLKYRMGYIIIPKPNFSGRDSHCRHFDLLLFRRFDSICHSYDRSLSHIILVTIVEIGKAGKTIDMCTSGSWTGSLAYIWSPEFPSWTDVPHCACNIKLHRPVELHIKVDFYVQF